MSDRTVTVDVKFSGLDKAAQDMDRLADKTKAVGSAMTDAERRSQGLAQATMRLARDVEGGQRDPAAFKAFSQLQRSADRQSIGEQMNRLDPDLMIRGDPGVAARSREAWANRQRLERQMDMDRRLFERSDPGSLAAATLGRRALRSEVDELTGDAAAKRAREAAKSDVNLQAQNRLASQQQNDAIKRQMRIMQGLPPEEEGPGGLAGIRQGLSGTGLARLAMPLFLTHAAAQIAEGAAGGTKEAIQANMTYAESIEHVSRRVLGSIPIIGGFAKALGDIADMPLMRAIATHQRTAEASQRVLSMADVRAHADLTAEGKIAGYESQTAGAGASYEAARRFSASLTPDVLAYYHPEIRPGFATARTGELRSRAGMAGMEAATAAERLNLERGLLAAQRAAAPDYAAQADTATAIGRGQYAEYWRNVENPQIRPPRDLLSGIQRPSKVSLEQMRFQTEETARLVSSLRGRQIGGLQADAAGRTRLFEIEKSSAQQVFESQQAAIAAGPGNRLDIVNQQLDTAKAGALAAGLKSPMETRALLELARIARDQPNALTTENKGVLLANPTTRDFFERQYRDVGARIPEQQQLEREFGAGQPLEGLEAQKRALENELTKARAASLEEFRKVFVDVFENYGKEMAKIAKQEAEAAEQRLRADQVAKQLEGRRSGS